MIEKRYLFVHSLLKNMRASLGDFWE